MLKVKYEIYTDDKNTTTTTKIFKSLDEVKEWLNDQWNGGHSYVPRRFETGYNWAGSFTIRIKEWWNGCTDIWIHLITNDDDGSILYSDGMFGAKFCDPETEHWLKEIRPIFCPEKP